MDAVKKKNLYKLHPRDISLVYSDHSRTRICQNYWHRVWNEINSSPLLLKGSKLIAIVNVKSRTVDVIRLFFYSLLSWIHSPGCWLGNRFISNITASKIFWISWFSDSITTWHFNVTGNPVIVSGAFVEICGGKANWKIAHHTVPHIPIHFSSAVVLGKPNLLFLCWQKFRSHCLKCTDSQYLILDGTTDQSLTV